MGSIPYGKRSLEMQINENVLIISASPRKHGNSDTLCDYFAKGAQESDNHVEKVFLAEKNIGYCTGCGVCNETHLCVQKDDMKEILDKMATADVIVFATPVYFYSMNGRMKNSYLLSASNTLKTSRCGYCHSGWACRPLLSIASCKPIGQSFRSVGLPSRHTGRCQNQPHGYLFCFIPCICVPPTFSALHPTDRAGGWGARRFGTFLFSMLWIIPFMIGTL